MESPTLPSLEGLTGLGLRSGVDMRPTLLRVLTDLYVQKLSHTPEEERHYTELALRLLDAVDVPTRAVVAARLARHLSPPLRIIQRLAEDLPDVAAPLRTHRLLEPAGKAEAPAQSPVTAPSQTAPASTGRAHDSGRSGKASSTIGYDIASELNEQFFAATAHERRLILLNLEVVAPIPSGRVSIARDALVGQRLEGAALARNRDEFAKHLAQSLHITREQALRIAGDDLGESIVAATKALNMPREVVYRILMFVNTAIGHSVERVHALAALYDEMTLQAAEHMVMIWQALHNDKRTAGGHRPLLWDDEARARARPAAAPAQRAPALPDANQRRNVS
jgi:uncharacterized protein (DUF2336 family)